MVGVKRTRPLHGMYGYEHGCRCDTCKAAKTEYRRVWAEAHPGYATAAHRKWRNADPERARLYGKAYHRRWRAANPERDAEAKRTWRAANPGREVITHAAYLATNPEVAQQFRERKREYERKRAAKRNPQRRALIAGVFIEIVDPIVVYRRDRWMCHICGKRVRRWRKFPDPLSVSLDHVVPLAKGGEHSYANCACSHLGCNSSKGAKLLPAQKVA